MTQAKIIADEEAFIKNRPTIQDFENRFLQAVYHRNLVAINYFCQLKSEYRPSQRLIGRGIMVAVEHYHADVLEWFLSMSNPIEPQKQDISRAFLTALENEGINLLNSFLYVNGRYKVDEAIVAEALMDEVKENSLETVKLLSDQENIVTVDLETMLDAFILAMRLGHKEITEYFYLFFTYQKKENRITIDEHLLAAVTMPNEYEIIYKLMQVGTATPAGIKQALSKAEAEGKTKIIDYLKRAKTFEQRSLLDEMRQAIIDDKSETVLATLSSNTQIATDDMIEDILHYAAEYKRDRLIQDIHAMRSGVQQTTQPIVAAVSQTIDARNTPGILNPKTPEKELPPSTSSPEILEDTCIGLLITENEADFKLYEKKFTRINSGGCSSVSFDECRRTGWDVIKRYIKNLKGQPVFIIAYENSNPKREEYLTKLLIDDPIVKSDSVALCVFGLNDDPVTQKMWNFVYMKWQMQTVDNPLQILESKVEDVLSKKVGSKSSIKLKTEIKHEVNSTEVEDSSNDSSNSEKEIPSQIDKHKKSSADPDEATNVTKNTALESKHNKNKLIFSRHVITKLVEKITDLERRHILASSEASKEFLEDKIVASETLLKALDEAGTIYFSDKPTPESDTQFKTACDTALAEAHKTLDIHEDWYEFLTNIALTIATLGIGLLIKGIVNVARGQSFFSVYQTDSSKKLTEIDDTVANIIKP